MKRIIIVGATSGIGLACAKACLNTGWRVGAAGRRREALEALHTAFPSQVEIAEIDITKDSAPEQFTALAEKLGGVDIYLHCSGVGHQNLQLQSDIEISTAETNAVGFIRMITAAYNYFKTKGGGHIAAISSIAGTKGLGSAPAYSATKRMQNTYLDALAQLAHMEHLPIRFTDIRPGFVATPLLRDGHYPLLMQPDAVADRILRALQKQERRVVIDRRYAVMVFFWKLIPQWIWERLNIRSKA